MHRIVVCIILSLVMMIMSCDRSKKKKLNYFHDRISYLLHENDSAVISASELTDFYWEKLCFEWTYQGTRLIFHYSNDRLTFSFDSKDYYIEEHYEEGSLDKRCISYNSRIQLIRFLKTVVFVDPDRYFTEHIWSLLRKNDSVIVPASKLTFLFYWEKVCFRITYEKTKLTFHSSDDKVVLDLSLDSKKYFVRERNHESSLDGRCISYDSQIQLTRFLKTVEFSDPNSR